MPENIFCYAPHRLAVVDFLYGIEAGAMVRRLSSINLHDRNRMAGHNNLTFFDVLGHPEPLPSELKMELRVRGATVVTLDDSYRRARYRSQAAKS